VCVRACACLCVSDYVIQLCQEIETKRVTWIIVTGHGPWFYDLVITEFHFPHKERTTRPISTQLTCC
jgi:hypothetical protein